MAWKFALRLIDRVEAELDRSLEAVTTIERALVPVAASAAEIAGTLATHDAVLGVATAVDTAIALARADQIADAVKKAKEAAQRIYEAVREMWERAKVTLEGDLRGSSRGDSEGPGLHRGALVSARSRVGRAYRLGRGALARPRPMDGSRCAVFNYTMVFCYISIEEDCRCLKREGITRKY